ncbi:MAG: polysaccharide deacetylase family protein [Clostridia bacterium]|nr:polysaccharide deacetylase family protein [Clostridia bacterium]
MWNGKLKAVTFSFDDGVTQDIRLFELFNRYGLKGTFNLNSERLGSKHTLVRNGKEVPFERVDAHLVKEIYRGHEVAVHTLTHVNLTTLGEEEIVRQVEEDRKNLSRLCGYEVVGMAYPCGGVNNDDRVAEIISRRTGVRYARTITSTKSFSLQTENRFRFNPSTYVIEADFEEVVDKFLSASADEPQLLYIWGHAYEMDAEYITWENLERILKKLSGREEIFYGTNSEVLFCE